MVKPLLLPDDSDKSKEKTYSETIDSFFEELAPFSNDVELGKDLEHLRKLWDVHKNNFFLLARLFLGEHGTIEKCVPFLEEVFSSNLAISPMQKQKLGQLFLALMRVCNFTLMFLERRKKFDGRDYFEIEEEE